MARLARTAGLTDVQQEILSTVRSFVDKEIIPQINTHFIVAHMIKQHGTPEQKQHFLPRMATGEVRGSFSMSEPDLGSDVAAIKTRARRDGDDYVIDGAKMWLTNGGSSNLIALLVKTDEGAEKAHQNLTTFLVEKPSGAIRSFELAIAYAQQRSTFGKPIAQHQAIAFKLAEMATKVEAGNTRSSA